MAIGIGLAILGVCGAASWALWLLSRRAAISRRWLLIVASAGIVAAITMAVLSQVDGVLKDMHPLSRVGNGVMDIVGDPARARNTVEAWQTWFTAPAGLARPPVSPRTVALWYLGIDTLVLVPAYVLFLGVLLRRSRNPLLDPETESLGRTEDVIPDTLVRFAQIAWIALLTFAAVPFFDLVENGMLWRFIERSVDACNANGCDTTQMPGDAYILLLRLVSYAKIWLLVATFLLGLAPAAVWLRLGGGWLRSLKPTLRRLRGQFVLLVLFFVLMKWNPQTVDVFRGWNLQQAIPAIVTAFLAGVVTWSVGRRATYVRRGLDAGGRRLPERDQARSRRSMVIAGLALVVTGLIGFVWDPLPLGLAIPGGLLLLLAWFDRAGATVEIPAPEPADRGRDSVPAALAAAWPILLAYFAASALFPLTMYDKGHSFALSAGVLVLWTFVFPASAIVANYYGLLYTVSEVPRRVEGSKVKRAVTAAMTASAPTATTGVPWLAGGLILLGLILWVRVVQNPWAVGQTLGAVTLVMAFFAVLAAVVGLAAVFIERTDPPGLFKVLRLQRIPLFSLVVLWLVLTNVIPRIDREDFHDVRTIRSGVDEATTSMGSLDVFERWVANNPALAVEAPPGDVRQAIPMILVASEGGGIKAATWTALVLDCVLSQQPVACATHSGSRLPSVLAMSGVSGGSLGIVAYTRYVADPAQRERQGDWIERTLGADFVSPSIAWQLYVETPRAWLQFHAGMDRAEVLERGWEHAWVRDGRFSPADALFRDAPASQGPLAEGFRAFWESNTDVPLMLLNGFSVQDGCKFVTTPIDANGPESDSLNCVAPHAGVQVPADPSQGRPGFLSGSRVISDWLCSPEDDVRLSTAALLSARFPYVSPTGRLLSCSEPRRAIQVVDGGYGENTGAGSVLELWSSIRPLVDQYNGEPGHGACIVPVLLQIQSGYGPAPDPPSTSQGELTAPPRGYMRGPNGFTVWQRNAAQLAVLDPLPFTGSATQPARQGVYVHVYPYAHPGVEAPLGWTLSDEARKDLRMQLSAVGNVQALGAFEDFLADPGACAPIDQAQAHASSA